MKSRNYDYWVIEKKLIPPVSENKFFAIAKIHEIGGDEINHGLGEVWGKTRGEVYSKMMHKVHAWIEFHQEHGRA